MSSLTFTVLASTIAKSLDEVMKSPNEKLFTGAAAVAAIFAGLSLLKIYQDYISNNSSLVFYEVIRPLLMVIIVANFNSFILGPWNFLSSRLCGLCDSGTKVSMTNYAAASRAALDKCVNIEDLNKTRFEGIKQDLKDAFGNSGKSVDERFKSFLDSRYKFDLMAQDLLTAGQVKQIFNEFEVRAFCEITGVEYTPELGHKHIPASMWLFGILAALANCIMYLCQIAFEIYARGMLYVLSYVGVVSFALGTWGKFRGSIDTWLMSYLKVSLWLPLFHLACGFVYSSGGALLNTLAVKGDSPVAITDYLTMLATCIVTIVIMTKIDTLSDMIVSGGSNAAAGGMGSVSSTTGKAVSVAAKIAG